MDAYRIGLDFLGGAMEVGASCILVELCGQRILLDAGIRQKAGVDLFPDFRRIQDRGGLDAIVVSHAHMDHTGSLPVISKAYPNARVYTTPMTIDLTRVLLYDSIKLMSWQEEGIPAYAEKDVEALFGRMLAVRYEQPLEILPGITLTLYQAGHIAGAACVYLQSKEGSLFYSGDFSAFSQNTIEGIRIPKLRPDVAIVESTYGDCLHSNRQVEERVLVDTAAECIEKGGKMLIPTFALGRAQEVLLILRRAMNRGELPKVRVYVDGMVRDMNTAYIRNPWFLKNALAKPAEQNLAMFCIDSSFEGEEYRPYKKGIFSDQYGKYIQLFFLSPALGARQSETIQRIADQIGWRLRIAPGVNQNVVLSIVQQICSSQGVELRKAPSYLPSFRSVQLKPAAEYTQMDAVCHEVEKRTGLPCRVVR